MLSQIGQSPKSEESVAETLYFSYGSNMHLRQMAARCPDSTLYAKGVLRNHIWQINSRGGANVTKGILEDFVEGIVFKVSPSDIEALRRYEGIKQEFYEEEKLEIEVECLLGKTFEGCKTVHAAESLAHYRAKFGLKESY